MKWLRNAAAKILALSVIWFMYVLLVIVPFAEKFGFFNEAYPPPADKTLPYFLLTTPLFLAYVIYVIINFSKVSSLRSLVYPALVFNLYTGFFVCLMVGGGVVLWFMIATIMFFVVALVISFSIGLARDSRSKELSKRNVSFCPKCGSSQTEDARFCANCGAIVNITQKLNADVSSG
ncbi:MAG: zinc ribbon domain-containing protein [Dehalococcoidia bacterium]|nr:zinc ribbon domain-containing protein [Dehalococcoidia bacterium]